MRLELVHADITEQRVDAIVNAANSSLLGGGGVDGAIHRRGGPAVLAACRELRNTTHPDGLPPGHAVHTTAGELPARWVIHTVGPIHGSGSVTTLRECYRSCLSLAAELGARTIAFPLISAGAYGWPLDEAIEVAVAEIRDATNDGDALLVLFAPAAYARARELATN